MKTPSGRLTLMDYYNTVYGGSAGRQCKYNHLTTVKGKRKTGDMLNTRDLEEHSSTLAWLSTQNQARPSPAGSSPGNKLSQILGVSSLFPYLYPVIGRYLLQHKTKLALCICAGPRYKTLSSHLQNLPDSLTLEEPEIDEDLIENNVRKIQTEIHEFQEHK